MTAQPDPQTKIVLQRTLADLDMRLAILELLLTERRQGWLYRVVLKDATLSRDALTRRIQRVRGTVRRTAAELGLTMADVRFDWLLMEFLTTTEDRLNLQLGAVAPEAAAAIRDDLKKLNDFLPALEMASLPEGEDAEQAP